MATQGTSSAFQRPLTAQEAVLAELRRNIVSGRWRPGAPIRQDSVAAELGVSRVPVREALKILEGEGQVQYRPHRGYTVAQLDIEELKEIYRIRELLEAEAVRHALPRLTGEDLERMREAMADMEASSGQDIGELNAANRRFHLTLYDAAGKPRLQHFIRVLWDSSDPYRAVYYMRSEWLRRVYTEHRRIYSACLAKDEPAVIDELQIHRDHAIEGLSAILADN